MFSHDRRQGAVASAATMLELIFHNTVRSVRRGHNHALVSIVSNIFQNLTLVAVFYVMFSVLGLRGTMIRGDFILFLMSGIFLFMLHVKSVGAVAGSEGPSSAMMKHLPMNTSIAIASAALGALYVQVLSVVLILTVYHLAAGPIYIQNPIGALGMLLLAWLTGVSVGLVFLAIKPWAPGVSSTLSTIYSRISMIASGKMFLANSLPTSLWMFFSWHPLFHVIDQARGFVFLNYTPHTTSITYPLVLSAVLITVGLLGEYYTRKHASLSWSARR
ncbi:MAG: ABC transporter permease [Rhodobacteraceae bacterium]|nr:ABC transporter permease [Paracoccaceae bacterium]